MEQEGHQLIKCRVVSPGIGYGLYVEEVFVHKDFTAQIRNGGAIVKGFRANVIDLGVVCPVSNLEASSGVAYVDGVHG